MPRQNRLLPSSASLTRANVSQRGPDSTADALLRAAIAGIASVTASSGSQSNTSGSTLVSGSWLSPSNAGGPSEGLTSQSLAVQQANSPTKSRTNGDWSPSQSTLASAQSSGTARAGVVSPKDKSEADRRRMMQLQRETAAANASARKKHDENLFKSACSTDMLFLMDVTNSMRPYIDSAKQQVESIVKDVKEAFLNAADFLDFTTSTSDVEAFLGGLKTAWGGDFAEDVLGGLHQALKASWVQQTRCIIHIGDAPPHGCELHDMGPGSDDYYSTGSEPHHLTHGSLLEQLVKKNINYAMLHIQPYTDRTALAFGRYYGEGNAKLLETNKYAHQINRVLVKSTGPGGSGRQHGPQFEELHLGIKYTDLRHLVIKTVTSSFLRTVGRLTLAPGNTADVVPPMPMVKLPHRAGPIAQGKGSRSNASVPGVVLEQTAPQWSTPEWLDKRLEVEGFCPSLIVHDAGTLNNMMAADANIKLDVAELVLHVRSRPFAKGALRAASYAQTSASNSKFVVKSFMRGRHGLPEVAEDMRIQALCKAFALEFNALVQCDPPLDFVVAASFETRVEADSGDTPEHLFLEPYIPGKYVKYNSNGAYVNEELAGDPFNQMAQAFSHFTFERSWGHMLVNDLQGVGHLLTDPSVQTQDPERFKLCDTNLGADGIKFFFVLHVCNTYCAKLGLKSTREMVASGQCEFREHWPTMEPTVCCSNVLCRAILRLASAKQSDDYPFHHWCESCYKQLQAWSTTMWTCAAPGPDHEFKLNRFFYESQGKLHPHECPRHRAKDTTASSAMAVGASMFGRMRSPGPNGTISGRQW